MERKKAMKKYEKPCMQLIELKMEGYLLDSSFVNVYDEEIDAENAL